MAKSDQKADLRRYLQDAREALLRKLDGLSEYDVRRPLAPTGTNLLGLVKHLAGIELGYFGDTFGRPSADKLPWDEIRSELRYVRDPRRITRIHYRPVPANMGARGIRRSSRTSHGHSRASW